MSAKSPATCCSRRSPAGACGAGPRRLSSRPSLRDVRQHEPRSGCRRARRRRRRARGAGTVRSGGDPRLAQRGGTRASSSRRSADRALLGRLLGARRSTFDDGDTARRARCPAPTHVSERYAGRSPTLEHGHPSVRHSTSRFGEDVDVRHDPLAPVAASGTRRRGATSGAAGRRVCTGPCRHASTLRLRYSRPQRGVVGTDPFDGLEQRRDEARLDLVDRRPTGVDETFTAAMTEPLSERTGAATERSPCSSSWSTTAYPRSRVVSRIVRSSRTLVTVVSVNGVSSLRPVRRRARDREAGEQDPAHRRCVRREAGADRDRDRHDPPARRHTGDVDDVLPVEHRHRRRFLDEGDERLHVRHRHLGQTHRGEVGESEIQHARPQHELAAVVMHVPELDQREQEAPSGGPRQAGPATDIAERQRRVLAVEGPDHRQPRSSDWTKSVPRCWFTAELLGGVVRCAYGSAQSAHVGVSSSTAGDVRRRHVRAPMARIRDVAQDDLRRLTIDRQ